MSLASPTVLLFDVDGTLIHARGAGRRALARAFESIHGTASWLDFGFSGMTDIAIVRQGLRAGGVTVTPGSIEALIACYVSLLPEEVNRSTNCLVYPGVLETLDQAEAAPSCALGLGTGNVQKGAKIKLARANLNRYFDFGGYGCDHEDRGELVRIGAQRGANKLGVALDACRVVVIGDTPRDVLAALSIGAECVGVGTGTSSPEELLSCGATAAFATLDTEGAQSAIFVGEAAGLAG